MRYRPPRVTTLLPDVYPPPPVDYYEAGLEPFGPQVDYEGEPVVYGPDYSATLEPVLEPGVLTEERDDFWGNPAALAAPAAPVIGAAGIVGGMTEPWSQSIAGEASAALQGNFDPFLGRREDGSQFSIQRELRGEVEGPTPGQEAYDTHSIPFVTGAIEAVADPLNALPVVGFGDDIARLTAKGAVEAGQYVGEASLRGMQDVFEGAPGSLVPPARATGRDGMPSVRPLRPDEPTVKLFRGDARPIENFAIGKADTEALFGQGIYLTDNPRIATDYTKKGASALFRYGGGPKTTKQDVIDAWVRRRANDIGPNGESLGIGGEPLPPMVGDPVREARMAAARQRVEAELPNLEIRKQADNSWTIQRKERSSTQNISSFDVPQSVLQRALDAEAPIPDEALAAFVSVVRQHAGRGHADDVLQTVRGAIRAADDGDGDYPTLRQIYQAAARTFDVTAPEFQTGLRRALRDAGYTGIRYEGGLTMGGGRHNAYVFWDEQGLKRLRSPGQQPAVRAGRPGPVEPPPESPRVDIADPDGLGKELGFARTLRTSENTTPAVREVLEQNRLTYEGPRSTQGLYDAAKETVDADPQTALVRLLSKERYDDADVAQAQVLIGKFSAEGDVDSAAVVAEKVARELLGAGRAVQAASIWDRLTPEGVLVYANRVLQNAAEKGVKQAAIAGRLAKNVQAITIDAAKAQRIADEEALRKLRRAATQAAKIPETANADVILERLAALKAELAEFRKASRAEVRAEAKLDDLAKHGVIDVMEETAAIRERLAPLQKMLADYYRAVGQEERLAAITEKMDIEDIPAAIDAIMERTAALRDQVNAYRAADRSLKRAEASKEAVEQASGRMIGDAIVQRQAEAAAARAELAQMRQRVRDLQWFTDLTARRAQPRVISAERETIMRAKRVLRPAGIELPRPLAESLLDRARILNDLPEGSPERYIASRNLMADIQALVPPRAIQQWLDVFNLPRALAASLDFSAPFRQGVLLAAGHPVQFAKQFGPMFRAAWSETYFRDVDAMLHTRPLAEVSDKAGLYIAPVDGVAQLGKREEMFASRLAGKIPGIKQSERAYVTFLNKLRADTFDSIVGSWQKRGAQYTDKDLHDLAEWINWATGRGSVGDLERSGVFNSISSNVFFSTRFMVSRVQAPLAGAKALASLATGDAGGMMYSRLVAAEISKDWAATLAAGTSLMALAAVGGAEVQLDPRSSEFGKIKVGPLRFDIWGGEQQLARTLAQAATGKRLTSTGRVVDQNSLETLGKFLRSKLSPQAGILTDLAAGEDFRGREMFGPAANPLDQLTARVAPMIAQNFIEAYKEAGLGGAVAATVPAAFGVGVQAYRTIRDIQNEEARKQFGRSYNDLDKGERRQVDDTAPVKQAVEEYELTEKVEPQQTVNEAYRLYESAMEAKEQEFTTIAPNLQGKNLREYIQRWNMGRYEAAKTTIGSALVQAARGENVDPKSLRDAFAEQYWSTQAELDPATGEPDFSSQRRQRQNILDEAQAMGVDIAYITERGEANYLGERFKDPTVKRVMAEYTKAQDTLRPYWEAKDKLMAEVPAYGALMKDLQEAERTGNALLARAIRGTSLYKTMNRVLEQQKEGMRLSNPDVEKALLEWGYVTTPIQMKLAGR